jgi:hypothetical protein
MKALMQQENDEIKAKLNKQTDELKKVCCKE